MRLAGQVALVTGASRGIGRATALALAREGARVVANYSASAEGAAQLVEEIQHGGGWAMACGADVSEPDQVAELFAATTSTAGRLDILVNNAGVTADGLAMRMSDHNWQRVLQVNLTGAFMCCRAAARIMLRQRSGRIINLSSVAGIVGNAGQANYSAAKAGLIGMTRALAKELATRGITVNAIAPGFISTDMTAGLSEELKQRAVQAVPLGRWGEPRDVADAVVFLASTGGAYITGQVLVVDGGLSMQSF